MLDKGRPKRNMDAPWCERNYYTNYLLLQEVPTATFPHLLYA